MIGSILWFSVLGSLIFGDASLAAVIAAVASLVNGFILLKARAVQNEIRHDVKHIAKDTEIRQVQIDELRSLSLERNRQILRLERLADRYDSYGLDDIHNKVESIGKTVTEVSQSITPQPKWDGVTERRRKR